MSQVEDADLDVVLSMALVITGKYRDLMEIRRLVREKIQGCPMGRLIHGTVSSVPLHILKEAEWRRLRSLESLETTGGDKKNG